MTSGGIAEVVLCDENVKGDDDDSATLGAKVGHDINAKASYDVKY